MTAGAYKVEPYHTQVTFSISHFGFADFSGFFSGAAGTLQIDPATAAAARLEVSIPVGSVLTTTPALDDMLKSDLTLCGVTAPLTLPFTLAIDGRSAHAKGHVELNRHTFGIGQGPWATDQWVAFEVGVDIDLAATPGN